MRNPTYLSDQGNPFLREFMDNDILSVLGFLTAVGNAATLGIFLHLNKLEDETNFKAKRTKISLKKSAVSLVYSFLIVFVVLVAKNWLPSKELYSALANSVGVAMVFFSLSVLRDLTLTVFGIPTKKIVESYEKKNRQ